VENLSPLCWGLNSSHTGYSQSLFWLSYPGLRNVKVCILDVPWTKLTYPTICFQEFCAELGDLQNAYKAETSKTNSWRCKSSICKFISILHSCIMRHH
jgi:hypothetical protein